MSQEVALFIFLKLLNNKYVHCVNGLFQCLNKRSFINKSTEKRKSGRSNKQSNFSETVSCCNSLEFYEAENSAKCEFRKRETKNKKKTPFHAFCKDALYCLC